MLQWHRAGEVQRQDQLGPLPPDLSDVSAADFHEFALHSIGQSEWAKAYYQHLREDQNKTHHAAVRSVAYKWIRIIFRCWKDGKPYDEEIYLVLLRDLVQNVERIATA